MYKIWNGDLPEIFQNYYQSRNTGALNKCFESILR